MRKENGLDTCRNLEGDKKFKIFSKATSLEELLRSWVDSERNEKLLWDLAATGTHYTFSLRFEDMQYVRSASLCK